MAKYHYAVTVITHTGNITHGYDNARDATVAFDAVNTFLPAAIIRLDRITLDTGTVLELQGRDPMPVDLEAGDRIMVTHPHSGHAGQMGYVVANDNGRVTYNLDADNDRTWHHWALHNAFTRIG